jgi:hypothetical protein
MRVTTAFAGLQVFMMATARKPVPAPSAALRNAAAMLTAIQGSLAT